jgi:peptide chain release factor 3
MAEEGVVQVFNPQDGSPALVGVVGPLQLDVLKARLDAEYNIEASFEQSEFSLARWIGGEDRKKVDEFVNGRSSSIATDLDGDLVFLAKSQFDLDYTRERAPGVAFTDVKDVKAKQK